jgi:hypothetical protein
MRTRTIAGLLTTALAGALALAPLAPASSAEDGPLRYVAMGDSYSAASGVLPVDPTAPPQCLRSTANFAHVIAARTGAALTDVTCGAAQTRDYFESQHPGVAPQLDALSRDTELVTMTIGGNDNNTFISAIVQCGVAGAATLGRGSPCKDRYGSSFADDIRDTTYPALVRALKAVHRRAPAAEVAILGYPWILPERVGCFEKMPVARGDVPYLRGIQALLNRKVRRAAEATGSTYVNLNKVSEGHDACQPVGTRWVEPVLTSTNPVVVHPNALGERRMATRTMKRLGIS